MVPDSLYGLNYHQALSRTPFSNVAFPNLHDDIDIIYFPMCEFCTLQHPAHVTSLGSVCDISFLRLSLNNTVSSREMQCTSLYGPTAHSPFLEAHFIAKKASYEICKAKCKMTLCGPFLENY